MVEGGKDAFGLSLFLSSRLNKFPGFKKMGGYGDCRVFYYITYGVFPFGGQRLMGTRQNILLFPKQATVRRDQMLVDVLEEHYNTLRRFIRMRELSEPLQEDVLQEVYLKLSKVEGLPETCPKVLIL